MARKNVIALLDNQPELGRGFKAQMARRRPVSRSEYRNAQRVTGKKDVDLADARDIRARGIKAPAAPSRPRRSRKTRTAPPAPKKKTPAPQYPTVNSRPVDDDPTKAHPRTGGRVGEAPKPRAEFNPGKTPPLGGFRQKVKVDENGGMSANEAPTSKPTRPDGSYKPFSERFPVGEQKSESKYDPKKPIYGHENDSIRGTGWEDIKQRNKEAYRREHEQWRKDLPKYGAAIGGAGTIASLAALGLANPATVASQVHNVAAQVLHGHRAAKSNAVYKLAQKKHAPYWKAIGSLRPSTK